MQLQKNDPEPKRAVIIIPNGRYTLNAGNLTYGSCSTDLSFRCRDTLPLSHSLIYPASIPGLQPAHKVAESTWTLSIRAFVYYRAVPSGDAETETTTPSVKLRAV